MKITARPAARQERRRRGRNPEESPAYHVQVAPHNPYGPVFTAACLHLCAAIPNFLILEYVWTNEPWRSRIQKGEPIMSCDGYLPLPDAPGLGIDLDEEILASRPFEPFDVYRRFDADGAVADV